MFPMTSATSRQLKTSFKKEKNIRFVNTHDGFMLPLVPGAEGF